MPVEALHLHGCQREAIKPGTRLQVIFGYTTLYFDVGKCATYRFLPRPQDGVVCCGGSGDARHHVDARAHPRGRIPVDARHRLLPNHHYYHAMSALSRSRHGSARPLPRRIQRSTRTSC